jgi:hypothetical protein
MEESNRNLVRGAIAESVWLEPRKNLRISDVLAEIRTGYIRIRSQKRNHLSQFALFIVCLVI